MARAARPRLAIIAAFFAAAACERAPEAEAPNDPYAPRPIATAEPGQAAAPAPGTDAAAEPAPGLAAGEPFVLVVLGDSLSAGDGLGPDAGVPTQVAALLAAEGLNVEVRSAARADQTARAALARFDQAVGADADGVLVQLGLADMLAGATPDSISANVGLIVSAARSRGLWVGLIGMRAPLDLDTDVRGELDSVYFDLAQAYDAPLYPYYFDGLIDAELGLARPELFLPDGLRPNEAGVARVAQGVAGWLAETLPDEAR